MRSYLLDANVLIALTVAEHEYHERASAWVAGIERFGLCPVVEGALTRFLIRIGESAAAARQVLAAIHALPRSEFVPASLSYVEVDLSQVRGHRQVTDAYLVRLAASRRDTLLATFDQPLAKAHPTLSHLING